MSSFRVSLLLTGAFLISSSFAQEIVVKPGDSLWALAKRYDTTIEEILEVNGLTGTDLMPGAILKLPGGSVSEPKTYTVLPGDTLYDIAVAFSIPVDELIAINNIDGTTIRPGQVLQLEASAEAPAPEPLVVTVKPGDSLWALAQAYDTTTTQISEANNISLSTTLKPGDNLVIPGRYASTSNADQGGAVTPTIKVAKGDSLWSIAKRYNTTVSALMSSNYLTDTTLKAGQVLKIVPSNELARAVTPATPDTPEITGMVWPLNGQITSRFGYRRLQIGGSNMHTGLDIDGVTGDPIHAAIAGVVTYSGWRTGYGNLVIIQAGNREYYYAHASELLVNVGDVVNTNQVIAKVGATGRVTGSHLHFEIRVDGTPIDPLEVLEQNVASR